MDDSLVTAKIKSSNIMTRDNLGRIAARHIDIPQGTKFGRLTIVGNERRLGKQYIVDCMCDCGRTITTRIDGLKIGKKKQCGDHRQIMSDATKALLRESNSTHGKSGTVEYNAWCGMKSRCMNANDSRYADYGGRGISVYPEWINDFPAFLEYIGMRPSEGFSLDRIRVDGNYEPGNARWANGSTQTKNRRPFLMKPGCGKNLRPLPSPAEFIPPPVRIGLHRNAKHGMKGTPEYEAWRAMKKRCLNPNHPAYKNYGGRGITIHAEWQNNFVAFLAEIGMRPSSGYSLDRIDNNRGYEPGNIRWSDAMTQNRNRRSFIINSAA